MCWGYARNTGNCACTADHGSSISEKVHPNSNVTKHRQPVETSAQRCVLGQQVHHLFSVCQEKIRTNWHHTHGCRFLMNWQSTRCLWNSYSHCCAKPQRCMDITIQRNSETTKQLFSQNFFSWTPKLPKKQVQLILVLLRNLWHLQRKTNRMRMLLHSILLMSLNVNLQQCRGWHKSQLVVDFSQLRQDFSFG